MKEFAQDRKDADIELDAREITVPQGKQGSQLDTGQEQVLGAPLARHDHLIAAQMGDPDALEGLYATMGNAAADMLLQGPLPLGQFNPGVASKIKTSTGVDISDATVELDPALDEEAKQGAAEAGERIYLAPTCQDQDQTLCHEGVHIVQGRGGSPNKADVEVRDVEQEAVEGAEAVLAGEPFVVTCSVGGERLYQGGGDTTPTAENDATNSLDGETPQAALFQEILSSSANPDVALEILRNADPKVRSSREFIRILSEGHFNDTLFGLGPDSYHNFSHALLIAEYGPEPLWPKEVREQNMDLLPSVSVANLLELNEGYRDQSATRNNQGHRVTKKHEQLVEVFQFPGQVSDVVLVIGGVHGEETQGQRVVDLLIEELKDASLERPYYTVIIIKSLYPDNSIDEARHVDAKDFTPYNDNNKIYECDIGESEESAGSNNRICIGTNRNFPGSLNADKTVAESFSVEQSYDTSTNTYRDANGSEILQETLALMKLVEKVKPIRILSLHSTGRSSGMFAVDPMRSSNESANQRMDEANTRLALEAAAHVAESDAYGRAGTGNISVQGNKLTIDSGQVARDSSGAIVDGNALWTRSKGQGISLGGYMPTEVPGSSPEAPPVKPAISTFTIEIPQDPAPGLDPDIEAQAYADAIRLLLFGPDSATQGNQRP